MHIEKILFVDDDPAIRKIAQMSLSKVGGWQVTLAESGFHALELVSQVNPDLLLLDVMMPGMDGPTTLKLIEEQIKEWATPVIFFTAKVLTHEVAYYRQLGVKGVIGKPFDPLSLPSEIREILDGVDNED